MNALDPTTILSNNLDIIITKCLKPISFWSDTELFPYLLDSGRLKVDAYEHYYYTTQTEDRTDAHPIGKGDAACLAVCDNRNGINFNMILDMYERNYTKMNQSLKEDVVYYDTVHKIYSDILHLTYMFTGKQDVTDNYLLGYIYRIVSLRDTVSDILNGATINSMSATLKNDIVTIKYTDDYRTLINDLIDDTIKYAVELYEEYNEWK